MFSYKDEIGYFISNLAMMKFILTEFKKTKLQSNFSFGTIIQFEPLHHRFIWRIIDNICNINRKSTNSAESTPISVAYCMLCDKFL